MARTGTITIKRCGHHCNLVHPDPAETPNRPDEPREPATAEGLLAALKAYDKQQITRSEMLAKVYEDGMRAGITAGRAGKDFEAALAEVNALVMDTDTEATAGASNPAEPREPATAADLWVDIVKFIRWSANVREDTIENIGIARDLLWRIDREAEARAATPPALDLDGLIAHLERVKRSPRKTNAEWQPEDIAFDVGVAAAQDAIRSYARLSAQATEPRAER